MAIPKKKESQKNKGKNSLKKNFNSRRTNRPKPSESELEDFIEAARDGNTALVLEFLDTYPSHINKRSDMGAVALAEAAENGELAVVQLLLSRGALPDTKDDRGNTALILAAYEGHCDIIDALLKAQAKVNLSNQEGETPLMRAVEGEQEAAVVLLLDNKAQVDASDKVGDTALMIAASRGYIGIMRVLLEHGASLRKKNHEGETAADCARNRRETEALELLREWRQIAATMQQAKEMKQKEQEGENGLRERRDAFIEKLKNNKGKGQRIILKKPPPPKPS